MWNKVLLNASHKDAMRHHTYNKGCLLRRWRFTSSTCLQMQELLMYSGTPPHVPRRILNQLIDTLMKFDAMAPLHSQISPLLK